MMTWLRDTVLVGGVMATLNHHKHQNIPTRKKIRSTVIAQQIQILQSTYMCSTWQIFHSSIYLIRCMDLEVEVETTSAKKKMLLLLKYGFKGSAIQQGRRMPLPRWLTWSPRWTLRSYSSLIFVFCLLSLTNGKIAKIYSHLKSGF